MPPDVPVTARPPFRGATRVLSSLLSPLERRALLAMARRMPPWVNSDHLTLLGLAAMLGAGLSFWLTRIHQAGFILVVVCLALNWFGDSLDGTLARVRGHERPRYGYYVDHIVDMLGATFLLGGMALSGHMAPVIALGVLTAFLLMSAEVFLAAHVLGEFQITYLGLGPTELRLLLSIGTLVLLVRPTATVLGHDWQLLDVGGFTAIVGLLAVFVTTATRHAAALYRAETRRH